MRSARWTVPAAMSATLVLSLPGMPFGGSHAPPAPPPAKWTGGSSVPNGAGREGGGGAPSGPAATGPNRPGPAGPGGSGPAGPTPAANGPSTGGVGELPDLSYWTWWWIYNRHPYLQLKDHLLGDGVWTGSDEFFLGDGQQEGTTVDYSVARPVIVERIGPALQRAVETGTARVQSDALIAIAKLHPGFVPQGKSMTELVSALLTSPNQKTAESAIVALGLTGDPRTLQILADIAKDNEAGRKHMGRTEVPSRTRPLAALALGAMGPRLSIHDARRMIVRELAAILEGEEGAMPDLHVACVIALGLNPLPCAGVELDDDWREQLTPASNRESQVRFLMEVLEAEDRHEGVRAHVPKALALLAQDASKELRDFVKRGLLDELRRLKRGDRLVQYGMVEALGLVGDADAEELDAEVRKVLHASVADADNNQRGLALIGLALASSRRGESAEPFAALGAERDYLVKQLASGRSAVRPWSALALGIQGYHVRQAQMAPSRDAVDAVLHSLADTKSPADAGAHFLALGLLGDPRAFETLSERLASTSDDEARGYAAIGLGLLGEQRAVEQLEAIVADSEVRHIPLHESSVALAMLGQKQAIEPLLATLAAAKSAEVKMHQLVVLGDIGDRRTVDPMVALLASDDELEQTRGYAATSLGIVCEGEGLPWTAAFMNHLNYHATTETLITGKGTGLLNLR